MSADSIDGSNKDSGGWGETYAGTKTTELSVEGYVTKGDAAYDALKDAFVKGKRWISAASSRMQEKRTATGTTSPSWAMKRRMTIWYPLVSP